MQMPGPIPPDIWRQMCSFFAARKTGRVLLHVSNGQVREVELSEKYRSRDEMPSILDVIEAEQTKDLTAVAERR